MPKPSGRYVRKMPQLYPNLQKARSSERDPGKIWRTIKFFFGLISIVCIVYLLFLSPFFAIKSVKVEGAVFTSEDAAAKSVPLHSNIWLLSSKNIERNLLTEPVIESASILRGIPSSVRIVLVEQKPKVIWLSGGTESLLNDQGIVFKQYTAAEAAALPAPAAAAIHSLPVVTDTKNLPVSLDQPVVGSTFIQFIQGVSQNMSQVVPEATIDHWEVADTSYDLTLVAKQGLTVQFNTLGKADVEVRNLGRLLHTEKVPLTAKVDLRVDRWAYVK